EWFPERRYRYTFDSPWIYQAVLGTRRSAPSGRYRTYRSTEGMAHDHVLRRWSLRTVSTHKAAASRERLAGVPRPRDHQIADMRALTCIALDVVPARHRSRPRAPAARLARPQGLLPGCAPRSRGWRCG